MDGSLAMANGLENSEEPAEYIRRCFGLSIINASKYEDAYMRVCECGATISIDDFMFMCHIGKNMG